jgi:hypothetical protein
LISDKLEPCDRQPAHALAVLDDQNGFAGGASGAILRRLGDLTGDAADPGKVHGSVCDKTNPPCFDSLLRVAGPRISL